MKEDEIATLDLVREEEIKELFRSPDPRNFIAKLKSTLGQALMQEKKAFNNTFFIAHPLLENNSHKNFGINLNQS